MKQLIQITTKLLLCLTCSFAHGSQTHSINLILAESEDLVFGDLDAVSVNDYLVFERNINGVKNIWSYHTINKTMTSLGVVDATRISGFRNQAAIETTANENDAVFITDGTPSGTSLLARKPELILESTQQAIYLLSPDFWNSRVYRYNGQSITEHDMRGTLVNNPNNKTNVCEFNDGSFEVLLNIRNFQGQINYTQFAGENVGFFSNDFLQIDNILGQCFVSVRYGPEYGNGTPGRLFYVFQPQGGLRSYGENEFVNSLANFTELNGKLYAVAIEDNQPFYQLHQLNPDTLESLKNIQVYLPDGYTASSTSPPSLTSAGDTLLVSYIDLQLFDEELVLLSLDQTNLSKPLYLSQQTEVFQNPDFTLFAEKYPLSFFYGKEKQNPELTFFSSQKFDAQFHSTQQLRLDRLHVNQSNQAVNLTAFDYNTQKLGYYQIDDQPKINQQINGIWFNSELSNQGFSISKGNRQNNSEYVFVTAYLFRDSAPLWLAGNADIDGISDTLTLELFEYDGPQLFEPNQTTNQRLFGQVELQLMSCNSLQVKLIADGQSNQLLLHRANNTTYQDWCQE